MPMTTLLYNRIFWTIYLRLINVIDHELYFITPRPALTRLDPAELELQPFQDDICPPDGS